EEQSAIGTALLLPFEQGGQSGTDHRVPSLSLTPVHPIPVVRTPIAHDLRVPQTRGVTMGSEICLTRTGGWRGKHASGFPGGPVSVVYPSSRFLRVSPACPGAQFHPGETIRSCPSSLRIIPPTRESSNMPPLHHHRRGQCHDSTPLLLS